MSLISSLLIIFSSTLSISLNASAQSLNQIKLPAGFTIENYVVKIPDARSMTWGEKGTLFVGTRNAGKVYAITPDKKIHVIADGLNMPNGVAFKNGTLYIAEISRISKLDNIENKLDNPGKLQIVADDFPTDGAHGWKFISFGPDGKLYVPIGAPCNICEPKDPYAAITSMDPDGGNRHIYARGIRNTVGFAWHPVTHELWFTDNGRDMLGDDVPADELNHATHEGLHFGYPYCHGGDVQDPDFGKTRKCSEFVPPEQKLGAHVASLGMRFYTGSMFPAEYKNQIFIAEHGSWNRSKKSGYRVTLVKLGPNGRPTSYTPFAEGFMQNETVWGRPVDVLVAPDGALLVSDDLAGAIYRISYAAKK